jgi:hypothetical protein
LTGDRDRVRLQHPGGECRIAAEQAGAGQQQRVAVDTGACEDAERQRAGDVDGEDAERQRAARADGDPLVGHDACDRAEATQQRDADRHGKAHALAPR